MENTIDTLESNAEETVSNLKNKTERVRGQFNETGERLKTQAQHAWDDFIDTVKRHPGKVVGVTLAAGFAIGALAASGRRRRYSPTDQLKDLASTGNDAWARVRSGFEDAVCTLKDAVEDAVSKFK